MIALVVAWAVVVVIPALVGFRVGAPELAVWLIALAIALTLTLKRRARPTQA